MKKNTDTDFKEYHGERAQGKLHPRKEGQKLTRRVQFMVAEEDFAFGGRLATDRSSVHQLCRMLFWQLLDRQSGKENVRRENGK